MFIYISLYTTKHTHSCIPVYSRSPFAGGAAARAFAPATPRQGAKHLEQQSNRLPA